MNNNSASDKKEYKRVPPLRDLCQKVIRQSESVNIKQVNVTSKKT